MKIARTFYGFCPTLNKDYSIEVDYLDVRTLDEKNTYIKGDATCNHYSFGGSCSVVATCPITAKAPDKILG